MNLRENFLAVMNYKPYERLPVIHFGYWSELLDKWAQEGHITRAEASSWSDGNDTCRAIGRRLGFDVGFQEFLSANNHLLPGFEEKIVAILPDGSFHRQNSYGVTELEIPGTFSIRSEISHLLTDRDSYQEHYQWRLQPDRKRLPVDLAMQIKSWNEECNRPNKLHMGSMLGEIRNWLGMVNLSYLQVDDPGLLKEIIDQNFAVSYDNTKSLLEAGLRPDMAHYWEDICFNHGAMISPDFFAENLSENYLKMSLLLAEYGCNLISVDCDGMIEGLLPLWLESGINVMFPIEIGTWHPDFADWRQKYGKRLRGIGGMNKHALSADKKAVDCEIERLKPLVELGGFIPCPDHRLPPETDWNLVCYYTERMRSEFC